MDWGEIWRGVISLDWSRIFTTVGTLFVSVLALFKWGERQKALRDQIAGELELLASVEKNQILNDHTGAPTWLHGKILLDIAKLTGVPIGTKKKPIPWGSVILAGVFCGGLSVWTYILNSGGFVWYSLIPGIFAVLFAVSILGLVTNREIPPGEGLPPGAVAVRSESATEQVVASVAKLTVKTFEERFAERGVASVALHVFERLQNGDLLGVLGDVDPLWLECRLRSWLWNNYLIDVFQGGELDGLLSSLKEAHQPAEIWDTFIASEGAQFSSVWRDFGVVGAGTTRRRMSLDTEVVVLAPIYDSGGYFVSSATALPVALTFLMREHESGWKLVNHGAAALPLAEWPPIWWMINDPALMSEQGTLDFGVQRDPKVQQISTPESPVD